MTDAADDMNRQLHFSRKLQAITNKIHATADIDEIMVDLSQDICDLFGCERLTIYVVCEDRTSIRTRIKTGMSSFKDFSLPISEASIAGYVALYKRTVNVRNVYDSAELASHTPPLQFVRLVDERTGYHTRETLCAPIVNAGNRELLGVVQFINNRVLQAFTAQAEEGLRELCATLAIALAHRMRAPVVVRTKYDPLVAHALLDAAELALAARSARRKGLDIEDVLVDEFQVQRQEIGLALSHFFGVTYEPFREERARPDEALIVFARREAEFDRWLPIELREQRLRVMTTDPERVIMSGCVEQYFPGMSIDYCVTTKLEFRRTIDQFFGNIEDDAAAEKSNWDFNAIDTIKAAERSAADRVHTCVAQAFTHEEYADIGISLQPLTDKTVSRFRKDGSLECIRGSMIVEYQLNFGDAADH